MRGGNQDKRLQLNENRIRQQHHHEANQFRTESKQFSEKERETEHQKRITNMTRTEWERAWTAKREKEKGKSELGTVEAPSQPASQQPNQQHPASRLKRVLGKKRESEFIQKCVCKCQKFNTLTESTSHSLSHFLSAESESSSHCLAPLQPLWPLGASVRVLLLPTAAPQTTCHLLPPPPKKRRKSEGRRKLSGRLVKTLKAAAASFVGTTQTVSHVNGQLKCR